MRPRATRKVRELLFYDLLAHGIYTMPRRGFMALSLPLTEADFATLESAVEEFVSARELRCWPEAALARALLT